MEPSELVRRGEETYKRIYEGDLRAHLEATELGKYCVLDIETGEHLIADTAEEALAQFSARFAGAFPYLVRIGMPRLVA
jgi:hypothetical protein